MNINIFRNAHIAIDRDIDIFQIVLIDIDIDNDNFKISFSSLSFFPKNSYQYVVDIDFLTISVNILSIFHRPFVYLAHMISKLSFINTCMK